MLPQLSKDISDESAELDVLWQLSMYYGSSLEMLHVTAALMYMIYGACISGEMLKSAL